VIGVVDYGAGNLRSVTNALEHLGVPFEICATADRIDRVERVVLPGVGHFGAAARTLAASGMHAALRRAAGARRPLLGICLGMQLLLDGSAEAPGAPGLGLLGGRSVRLETRTVPHMGWNGVRWGGSTPIAAAAEDGHYYFAHSYAAEPADPRDVVAFTEIEGRAIPSAIGRERFLGVQFHPEKSGELGLALLEAFCRC
jgi:glutamine amidotransferase